MQIIAPNYILSPDMLHENLSVAFDKTIHKIGPLQKLKEKYPDAEVINLKKNSLLMPGLINAHVHLEFSANKTNLKYGDFMTWLYSVIENREEIINNCDTRCISKAIDSMLASGITTFGAVSSYGLDLDACENAKQNVVFFNELIGSQATMADALFNDFKDRLNASKSIGRNGFYPAIAVHSPYSVHPVLINKALSIAKEDNLRLSAHFMESKAERDWLDESDGDFKKFFKELLNQHNSVSDSKEFLEYFNSKKTLLTHATKTNDKELDAIAANGHTIVHCPISNRLLGNGSLNIKKLNEKNIKWIVATDGLSSNYKLDLFEEMKISLFMHSDEPLLSFAKELINGVTIDAADALDLNTGEIKEGKNADMLILDLDETPTEELAIHLILHRYNISKVYINGKLEKGN
ncbi:MAG: metal-dependent hydrolase [Sulfurimonas sp.]|nr:metal-dependent hydrolase [Sulfurimonas sp.]